ncbi:ras guanine nucleotide exchange factor domain-containing protein [Polychytrium aggregatum]|uniref:ras guanine nucleotide exchange factor domain-containing protein n=1 Tax=Polychytrium aggregatum TaxID=110093 RepID=UPI0022FEA9DD|nr:ras guanine nucleotide exchange factor domain-containing protein [Polychytrium aggregatum]KAI9202179.1 ras guanine nucleotide exchange factor domain-containing protein [Polychytrium aggregatum]
MSVETNVQSLFTPDGSSAVTKSSTTVLLRVQLPDSSTTVIQLDKEMTMWEIVNVICAKKGLAPSRHDIKVLVEGKEEAADLARSLMSYTKLERIILISTDKATAAKDTAMNRAPTSSVKSSHSGSDVREKLLKEIESTRAEKTLSIQTSSRRPSIMMDRSKNLSVRTAPSEFPKTVIQAEEGHAGPKKGKSLMSLSKMLFKQKSEISEVGSLNSASSHGSLNETVELSLPASECGNSRISLSSIDEHAEHSELSLAESSVLSSAKTTNFHVLDSPMKSLLEDGDGRLSLASTHFETSVTPDTQGSVLLPHSASSYSQNGTAFASAFAATSSVSSFSVDKDEDSDHKPSSHESLASLPDMRFSCASETDLHKPHSPSSSGFPALDHKAIRKRTISAGTAPHGEASLSIGRKATTPTGSKHSVDSIFARELENSGYLDPTLRRVTLKTKVQGQADEVVVKIPSEIMVESALQHICQKRGIDFATHTLEILRGGKQESCELDRTLQSYLDEGQFEDVVLVQKRKEYSTETYSDNGVDVMICQRVNKKLIVMAATMDMLLDRLVNDEERDQQFLDTFMMTYRTFMTPTELMEFLVSAFNIEAPQLASQEETARFDQMRSTMQKKVLNTATFWVEHHWHDFARNSDLRKGLEEFMRLVVINRDKGGTDFTIQLSDINYLIETQTKKHEEIFLYYKTVEKKGKMMESMFTELTPEELGKQMCIHNFKLFKNIHPIEFLSQIWKKPEDESTPCLDFFVSRFDKESYWVATEIVQIKDAKKRSAVLKNFIMTAKPLRADRGSGADARDKTEEDLGGRYGFMHSYLATRYPNLHKMLPDKTKKTYQELEKISDPSRNMKNYRDALAASAPPIVPFLPIYLKDLTFMNDGNQSKVREMINFDKLRMMANRVKDISALVGIEYKDFVPNPMIQNYLAKPPIEKSITKLKEMSLEW